MFAIALTKGAVDVGESVPQYQEVSKKATVRDLLFENLISLDALIADLSGEWTKAAIRKWLRDKSFPREKIRGKIFVNPVEVAHWLKGRPTR